MDPKFGKQLTDMRAMLEKTTSKVSVNDLKKKGFQKVKVIRASDINQMIYKAVRTVIAKGEPGMGAAEREKIIKESQAEFQRLMKQVQEAQKAEKAASEAQAQAQKQVQGAEAKALEVERTRQQVEQARSKLEEKVDELNGQLRQKQEALEVERREFATQKQQLESQKQELYNKGLDAQKSVVENFQRQVNDLENRLELKSTEATRLGNELAEAQSSSVHTDELARVESRAAAAESELEKSRVQIRELQSQAEIAGQAEQDVIRLRRRLKELEEREEKLVADRNSAKEKARDAEDLKLELDRVRGQYTALKTRTEDFDSVSTRVQRQTSQIDGLEDEIRKGKRRIQELELELESAAKRSKLADDLNSEVSALKQENRQIRSDLQRAEERSRDLQQAQQSASGDLQSKLSESEGEVNRLRMQLMEVKSEAASGQADMLGKIQQMFESHQTQASAAPSADVNDKLDKMMRSLSSIKSGTAGASYVNDAGDVDLSALFDNTKTQKIESNLDQVKMKVSKAGSVKGKLSKLKKLRGGG